MRGVTNTIGGIATIWRSSATVNGELLKGCTGGTAPAEAAVLCAETAEAVVLEEVALRTDANGLPASWRRSSDAFSEPPAAAAAAAADGGAAVVVDAPAAPPSGTPNRSRMLGVLLSEAAGSGAAANGFVPPFFSCKYNLRK